MMLDSFQMMTALEFTRIDMTFGTANALSMIGSVLMALGYIAWIMRGLQSARLAKPLMLLAPAGRMALTGYLLESVVCVLIFYNYGLLFYEQLSRAVQVLFVLALVGLQVAFSHWWLGHFRFGPAEWLWRAFTYLKVPRLKEQPPPLPVPPLMPSEG